MDDFMKKTFTTSRGLTYTYYSFPSSETKPVLLLQHGFPDDHELWSNIVPYIKDLGFPIVVPDLLGYGETSKPSDAWLYNSKGMAGDLMEIIDHEGYTWVISVGHDWGSTLAQRLALWHPDRIVSLIILNIPYRPPAQFDVEEANKLSIQTTGLPRLAYQQFFVSPGARQVIEDHLETAFHVLHGNDEGTKNYMEDVLCHHRVLEATLRNDTRQPLKTYAKTPGFKEKWIARMKRDGLEGPLNWYHALHSNYHWAVEKDLPTERHRLNIPVLFIGATMDAVGLTQAIFVPQKAGLLPDLTVKEIESGHWQTFEAPEKGGPIIRKFLQDKVLKAYSS
ncbi:uncharacterized protein PV09_01629 [Verruconis gallopava]|uniref:AB hydrolase-1 domain-containing protein n=1 Tax=Verruconis gallopava TaxID=253628 RepID=A0A0D2AMI2_9PEZI|nr:uncharacterized protein PV09_01629 [Verruconis gallopava]KIW07690.1 hypothetical protein PV09_01629 [Verruconis gallopava]